MRPASRDDSITATGLAAQRALEWPVAPVRARSRWTRGWLVRRALMVADVVGLLGAFFLTQALFPSNSAVGADALGARGEFFVFVVTLPAWVLVARLYSLYDRDEERADHGTTDDIVGVFHLVTVGAWLLYGVAWLTGVANPTLPKMLTFWGGSIVAITAARAVARAICRRQSAYVQTTIIAGAGDVGQLIARKLLQHPEYGLDVVGFVDDTPKERRNGLGDVNLLGTPSQLRELVAEHDVDRVIVAFSNDSHEKTLEVIRSLSDAWVQVDIVPRLFEVMGPACELHSVEGLPLLTVPPAQLSRSSLFLKRALDVTVSAVGLLLLAPLFAFVAFAIKRNSDGPVFFRQLRIGADGKSFRIYKFRTMVADADERKHEYAHLNRHAGDGGDPRMFKISDDPRVTRVGRFLRRYLIDELPQLINVLRGEMSLVGPRPLVAEEHRHVEGWATKRLRLKPGMTGLWQVLGASEIPFDEMVRLDYVYVTTWSLWNDIRLLLRTIPLLANLSGKSY